MCLTGISSNHSGSLVSQYKGTIKSNECKLSQVVGHPDMVVDIAYLHCIKEFSDPGRAAMFITSSADKVFIKGQLHAVL